MEVIESNGSQATDPDKFAVSSQGVNVATFYQWNYSH